ncbi:MAG: hypothetical protein R3Y67_00385 [Eubacteriales bacterium]
MSMPNIPNVNPTITVDRNDAVNIVLSSIGMEELGLAHLLNAEAEKIQFALGTLETANGEATTFENILATNKSANKMVRDVIKNQMLLTMKMEDTIDFAYNIIPTETIVEEPVKESVEKEPEVAEEKAAEPEPEVAEEATVEEEPVNEA